MTKGKRKAKAGQIVQEYLLLGLLTLAPIVATLAVLLWIIKFFDKALYSFFPALQIPIGDFYIPGLGMIATFVVLFVTGLFARTVAGRIVQAFSDSFLMKLPVVRGIYGMLKQMGQVFFSQDSAEKFKRVVYVPALASNAKAIAFVTGVLNDKETIVFLPTAPNPTSGYVLIFPNSVIEDANISVDQALQLVLSCGVAGPTRE